MQQIVPPVVRTSDAKNSKSIHFLTRLRHRFTQTKRKESAYYRAAFAPFRPHHNAAIRRAVKKQCLGIPLPLPVAVQVEQQADQ